MDGFVSSYMYYILPHVCYTPFYQAAIIVDTTFFFSFELYVSNNIALFLEASAKYIVLWIVSISCWIKWANKSDIV